MQTARILARSFRSSGCGHEGGLVELLAGAGYEVLGVDPHAPDGDRFVHSTFQELEGEWDAVVAGRVLHHVRPLDEGLDLRASFAPLLIVDEFAPERHGRWRAMAGHSVSCASWMCRFTSARTRVCTSAGNALESSTTAPASWLPIHRPVAHRRPTPERQ
jgi:hypothetical protein